MSPGNPPMCLASLTGGLWAPGRCTGYVCVLSCVRLFATRWTLARQASLFMGCFRQEYYSELPLPPPGHLPNLGLNLRLLHLLHCGWILYPQSHSREPPSPYGSCSGGLPRFQCPWATLLGWIPEPKEDISPCCSPSPPVSASLGRGRSLPFPW